MIVGLELLLILSCFFAVLIYALRRASVDWHYRLRLICVFDMLEMQACPWRPTELFEVVLVERSPLPSDRSITFALFNRPDEITEFILDLPLGEHADLCGIWAATSTPLLYVDDENGRPCCMDPLTVLLVMSHHGQHRDQRTSHDEEQGDLPGAPSPTLHNEWTRSMNRKLNVPSLSSEGVKAATAVDGDVTDFVEKAGHFRIYLGAAPGVGKTFAMLDEGVRRHKRGTDVVIGFCECHGRPLTKEKMDGLEVVPRKIVAYRGTEFEEMDLDAVLARRPKLPWSMNSLTRMSWIGTK